MTTTSARSADDPIHLGYSSVMSTELSVTAQTLVSTPLRIVPIGVAPGSGAQNP